MRVIAMKASATLVISLVSCLLISSPTFAASSKIYKWTDEKGQVHFSERPKQGTQPEVIKPQIGHSDPVNYATPSDDKAKNEKKPESQADAEKKAPKDSERCEAARKNLETLKTYARIRIKGEDGEYKFLTPDEQQQKTDEATKAIEESCD
jgi:Domain of unknown function (DUF4124)